jgi:hypothetical protein
MKPVANTWQIVQPGQKLASWVMEMEHVLATEIKKENNCPSENKEHLLVQSFGSLLRIFADGLV